MPMPAPSPPPIGQDASNMPDRNATPLGRWERALVVCALLATLNATLGQTALYMVFKPLTMVLAIAWIAMNRGQAAPYGVRFKAALLLGLVASLAGDMFLLFPGYFIHGLLAFLIAHLAYIALFSQGVGLFPRKGPLLLTLAVGTGMYTFLWHGGLPPGLRAPVAAYVLVIACMAAQALGRAQSLGNSQARAVATGACLFMLSDALLATNRFVLPLPLAPLWILGTYYAAQVLIVRFVQPPTR